MSLLEETLSAIRPLDRAAGEECRNRWNHLCMGSGRLGKMEDMVVQFAGVMGNSVLDIPKRCMVLACADHGVARHNLSAYPLSLIHI